MRTPIKTNSLLLGLLGILLPNFILAQDEIEIIRLTYQHDGGALLTTNDLPTLNQAKITTSVVELMLQYGHAIGNKGVEFSYAVGYQHFSQTLDASEVTNDSTFYTIPKYYYRTPQFSQISFITGISVPFGNNWGGFTGVSLNYTDDLAGTDLPGNLTWVSTTYIEKIKSERFSYGVGAFINKLENRFLLSPIVNVKIKNRKRGVELIFPEKLRVWQVIGRSSYLEGIASFNSLSLEYNPAREVASTDVFLARAGVTYHYIWEEFLKLSLGVNVPLGFYSVTTPESSFDYTLGDNLGFSLSVSFVIQNE